MKPQVKIIGTYISPYVRKVLAVLHLKGIVYELDPIIPFFGNDKFSEISPIRRIPVLIHDDVVLSDSTIICEYLEEVFPSPAVFPDNPKERAFARWLEEYADTRMGDVLIWKLFNQSVINKAVWGKKTDHKLLVEAISKEIPAVLDYLEHTVPKTGYFFGEDLTVADIAIAAPFRNADFAGYRVDKKKWPKCDQFIERVLQHESVNYMRNFEERLIRVPIHKHREELFELGAPLTDYSFADSEPRLGIMQSIPGKVIMG